MVLLCMTIFAQVKNDPPMMASQRIPAGAKVFNSPIIGSFDIYLAAGIHNKKVLVYAPERN